MHVTSRSRGRNLKHLVFQLQLALFSVVVYKPQRLHAMPCKTFVTVQVKPNRDPNLKGHVPFLDNQYSKRLRLPKITDPKTKERKKKKHVLDPKRKFVYTVGFCVLGRGEIGHSGMPLKIAV